MQEIATAVDKRCKEAVAFCKPGARFVGPTLVEEER
jgi:hypothetical protein